MSAAATKNSPPLPAAGVRTLITFLLFVHFFMVAAAVLGNLDTTSPLMRALINIRGIKQYLGLLHLNTAFQFPLADERDHRVLLALDVPADLTAPGAAADSDTPPRMTPAQIEQYKLVQLTPENVFPGIRRRRYLKLGQVMSQIDQDASLAFLSVAMANALLQEQGLLPPAEPDKTKRNHLLCLQYFPPAQDGFEQLPEAERKLTAPRWQSTVYDGWVYPAGDKWSVTERVRRSEASGAAPQRIRPPVKKSSQPATEAAPRSEPATSPTAKQEGP
jgi:hypothetical protein